MEPVIRMATKADIPGMVKLRRELLEYVRKAPLSDADIAAIQHFYTTVWNGTSPAYFVCPIGKAIVGQAAVSVFPALPSSKNPSGLCGYVYDVSVMSSERRKGIARALITALLWFCKDHRIGYLALDATDMGEPLYRSLGFKEPETVFLELWKDGLDTLDVDG
nr:GNAT family N-acetyltransferase [Candidatus Sigynarchaeota archaeon]